MNEQRKEAYHFAKPILYFPYLHFCERLHNVNLVNCSCADCVESRSCWLDFKCATCRMHRHPVWYKWNHMHFHCLCTCIHLFWTTVYQGFKWPSVITETLLKIGVITAPLNSRYNANGIYLNLIRLFFSCFGISTDFIAKLSNEVRVKYLQSRQSCQLHESCISKDTVTRSETTANSDWKTQKQDIQLITVVSTPLSTNRSH